HHYQIGDRTVGTWAYNDLTRPTDRRKFFSKFLEADRLLRHPKEMADMVLTNGTEYCGNCLKICIGKKEDTAALFKLHLNSGVVDIPDDPSISLNLISANAKLEKYRVPVEEVMAIVQTSDKESLVSKFIQ
ncbi:MAG: hypothetical protein V3V37_07275, partial [Candidatus Adiutricales bacterium]